MHVPDGFFDSPTCMAAAGVSLVGVGYAVREVRRGEHVEGLGLLTAFIFAAQMVNFPIGAGTSGHLMGGALAAIVLGPAAAVVCMSVVLVVQAVVFADGGIFALGINISLMAIIAPLVGWAVYRSLRAAFGERRHADVWWCGGAAAMAGCASVVVAAGVFSALFWLGGTADIALGEVAAAMISTHLLIGLGEALITGVVVVAVLHTRAQQAGCEQVGREQAASEQTSGKSVSL